MIVKKPRRSAYFQDKRFTVWKIVVTHYGIVCLGLCAES